MLSNNKTGMLQAFLGSLPSQVAAQLAQAVEVDRLMDGAVLPHADILSGLRPVLRNDNRDHTPTPLRLFCRPFQDLLSSAPRVKKQKAVIVRASVLPVWQWLSQTLIPAECAAYTVETKAMILARKYGEAAECAIVFCHRVGEAMAAALAGGQSRKTARALLGGDLTLADAAEISLLLPAAASVFKIQELMPKPVGSLDEALLWELRAVYDGLVQTRADAAPFVAVIAMNRLARPWEALKLPRMIARQSQDTLISQTDMGLVGEILMARMGGFGASIQAARHPQFDPEKLIEDVRSFTEFSTAMVREIEIRRDGEWGQNLLKDRTLVGEVMEGFMDRAPAQFAAGLPTQKNGGRRADFSRPVDDDKRDLARRYARLVVGCRKFAAAASFAARHKDAFEEMSAYLQRYNEDVIKELRTGDPIRRAVAESQFQFCSELTALLFSEEEAELLRRRGRVAQGAT